LQKKRVSGCSKLVAEHTIRLIFLRLAFETVQCPVSPINISFFQILYEVIPRDILTVVAKLSQKIRISHSSDESLRVEKLLLEIFIRDKAPGWDGP
jgi:hypothetical protein